MFPAGEEKRAISSSWPGSAREAASCSLTMEIRGTHEYSVQLQQERRSRASGMIPQLLPLFIQCTLTGVPILIFRETGWVQKR